MRGRIHPGAGWGLLVAALGVTLAVAGCGERAGRDAPRDALVAAGDWAARFLASHWRRPLESQGTAPAGVAQHEAPLHPENCGACHQAQYEDWSASLHSRAMGPGVLGQLVEMDAKATDQHQDCLRCHAPLAEQAASLAASLAAATAGNSPRGAHEPGSASPLHTEGIVCAACHMRGYRVYGPPRRDGTVPETGAGFPHAGWVGHGAFEDSRFCAACHQFDEGGYALNGKLLENTYEEWRASRHAREGRACQSCHMPDRQHLWRGIHDSEMTRRGIAVSTISPRMDATNHVNATLRMTNTGAGHYFPTYVTPRVVVTIAQESARGDPLKDTAKEYVIGRQVTPDLSEESFDTRIAPDEERVIEYRTTLHPRAARLAVEIRVEPDAFYTRFYRSLLKDGAARRGRALIAKALEDSLASRYTLYSDRQPLLRAAASDTGASPRKVRHAPQDKRS